MKTSIITIAALTLFAAVSTTAMAEGSKIQGSTIVNASSNNGNLGVALGKDSTVNTGSVSIKGSEVKGSTVINASQNAGNLGVALGKGSTVNTGSVDIK